MEITQQTSKEGIECAQDKDDLGISERSAERGALLKAQFVFNGLPTDFHRPHHIHQQCTIHAKAFWKLLVRAVRAAGQGVLSPGRERR